MKIKSQRDFWSGLIFVVVGVGFAIGATNYSMGSSAKPGPGYFPLMLSVIMALLGAIVLFKSMTIETEGGDPVGAIAWRPLFFIVLAILSFAALLPRTGIFVAGATALGVVSMADGPFRPLQTIAGAALGMALSFVLVMYVAPGFAWNFSLGVDVLNTALGLLCRAAFTIALLFGLNKLLHRWRTLAEAASITLVLLSASVWTFIQGLKLLIPLAPFLNI